MFSGPLNGGIERRKHQRERADAAVELIWKDDSGNRCFECGRLVDCSPAGAGIDSPQPVAASSCLIVRAPGIGSVALAQVRNSAWRRTQYRLGVQFMAKASIQPSAPGDEPDYHELLRAGVSGDADRIDRLYRALAFRYHPDNSETGNAEIFVRINQVHRILSASQPRPAETGIARPVDAFRWKEDIRELKDKRGAVLGLLCQRRMSDYRNAAVSHSELESLTGLKGEELGFILWYLREKGAVTLPGDSSDYAISALGVDLLEHAHQVV